MVAVAVVVLIAVGLRRLPVHNPRFRRFPDYFLILWRVRKRGMHAFHDDHFFERDATGHTR